jgi:hypothetical protein
MRWPTNAESERQEALECAQESARLLDDANELLRLALDLCHAPTAEARIARAMAFQAQARAHQERIQRLLLQAQFGR